MSHRSARLTVHGWPHVPLDRIQLDRIQVDAAMTGRGHGGAAPQPPAQHSAPRPRWKPASARCAKTANSGQVASDRSGTWPRDRVPRPDPARSEPSVLAGPAHRTGHPPLRRLPPRRAGPHRCQETGADLRRLGKPRSPKRMPTPIDGSSPGTPRISRPRPPKWPGAPGGRGKSVRRERPRASAGCARPRPGSRISVPSGAR